MAVASTKTKLPLAVFAKYLGMHPLHFEQVYTTTDPHCDQIMMQYEWQAANHVSREEMARVIAEAESKIENALGYRLAPCWEVDEWRPIDQPYQPEYVRFRAALPSGRGVAIDGNWGYFISGGIEAKSLIGSPAIVWSDADSDGYKETGTVVVATSFTDVNEIAAYYPGKEADDAWEIRPIEVSITGGVATITFRRELTVLPEFFTPVDEPEGADGLDDANFLVTVDIYRHYNDPSQQVSLLWEPFALSGCSCGSAGCPSCAYSAATGCLLSRGDPRLSQLLYNTANWNTSTLAFDLAPWPLNRTPDIARLYYRSGWREKGLKYSNSRMAPEWERIVAHMAAAMLDRPPCDCAEGNWRRWRYDLTIIDGSIETDNNPIFRNPSGITDNPFGTTRGEVDAWRNVARAIIAKPAHFPA